MKLSILGVLLALSGAASAADIKIHPYDGARLLAGQLVDVRVEVNGLAAGEQATITLDGQPLAGLTPQMGENGGWATPCVTSPFRPAGTA